MIYHDYQHLCEKLPSSSPLMNTNNYQLPGDFGDGGIYGKMEKSFFKFLKIY